MHHNLPGHEWTFPYKNTINPNRNNEPAKSKHHDLNMNVMLKKSTTIFQHMNAVHAYNKHHVNPNKNRTSPTKSLTKKTINFPNISGLPAKTTTNFRT